MHGGPDGREELGSRGTPEAAARLYDTRAFELGKPLNFPDEAREREKQAEKLKSGDAIQARDPQGVWHKAHVSDVLRDADGDLLFNVLYDDDDIGEGVLAKDVEAIIKSCDSYGVSRQNSGCYQAIIRGPDGTEFLGSRDTEEKAARLYDKRAFELGKIMNLPPAGYVIRSRFKGQIKKKRRVVKQSGYQRFWTAHREEVKAAIESDAANAELPPLGRNQMVMTQLGERWSALDDAAKAKWNA